MVVIRVGCEWSRLLFERDIDILLAECVCVCVCVCDSRVGEGNGGHFELFLDIIGMKYFLLI